MANGSLEKVYRVVIQTKHFCFNKLLLSLFSFFILVSVCLCLSSFPPSLPFSLSSFFSYISFFHPRPLAKATIITTIVAFSLSSSPSSFYRTAIYLYESSFPPQYPYHPLPTLGLLPPPPLLTLRWQHFPSSKDGVIVLFYFTFFRLSFHPFPSFSVPFTTGYSFCLSICYPYLLLFVLLPPSLSHNHLIFSSSPFAMSAPSSSPPTLVSF